MELFVTGATGVLGRATLPLLLAAGHRVRGLARSAQNETLLRRSISRTRCPCAPL